MMLLVREGGFGGEELRIRKWMGRWRWTYGYGYFIIVVTDTGLSTFYDLCYLVTYLMIELLA